MDMRILFFKHEHVNAGNSHWNYTKKKSLINLSCNSTIFIGEHGISHIPSDLKHKNVNGILAFNDVRDAMMSIEILLTEGKINTFEARV